MTCFAEHPTALMVGVYVEVPTLAGNNYQVVHKFLKHMNLTHGKTGPAFNPF
jgi:hypothetical protein